MVKITKETIFNHFSNLSEMLKGIYDNLAREVFERTNPGPAKPTRYRNHQERRCWKDLHKHRAELKQALHAYKDKPTDCPHTWHEEVCEDMNMHRDRTSAT